MKTKGFNKLLLRAKKLKVVHKTLTEEQYHISNGTISVTDFDTTFTIKCEAVEGIEGAVSRRLIDKFFSKVKDVEFSFIATDLNLIVKTKFGESKFPLEQSELSSPSVNGTELGWFNGSAVIRAGKYIANNELRPSMDNVCLRDCEIASTDSHRMMFLKDETNIEDETLIHKNSFSLLDHGKWTVFGDDKFLRIERDEFTIVQKVMGYVYPNYRAVIPVDAKRKVIIKDVAMFREQLSMAILAANPASGLIVFNENTLESEDLDFETSFKCTFDAEIIEGGRFGFKGDFLSEYVKDQSKIEIEWTDAGRAFVINGEFLLMPMAIS